jgi:hypothetical protein
MLLAELPREVRSGGCEKRVKSRALKTLCRKLT